MTEGTYFFPIFSHSHCATASGELVASLPAARKLASRIVGDVDPAEQRLQRGAQRLVVGALRREQHHRVIGRDRVPGIVQHHQIVFRDQPVAGIARDDVDFAGRRPPHT